MSSLLVRLGRHRCRNVETRVDEIAHLEIVRIRRGAQRATVLRAWIPLAMLIDQIIEVRRERRPIVAVKYASTSAQLSLARV